MKKEDVVKKMNEIKNIVEKNYPGVKADVTINDWEKGGYHRLYINLVVTGLVNGKTARESSSFGFLNLKTNRYNTNGAYDMRHFDGKLKAAEFSKLKAAEFINFYANAYKADDNGQRYIARPGFTDVLNVKPGQHLSKKEMLDKSWAMGITPEELDTYWDAADAVNCTQATQAAESKDGTEETEIGSYDGHIVTISPSTDKYVVKDDGKYTGDYGRDCDDALYEASMYLYDRMAEGHVITVLDDTAWGYIVENAAGLRVSLDIETETHTMKKGE